MSYLFFFWFCDVCTSFFFVGFAIFVIILFFLCISIVSSAWCILVKGRVHQCMHFNFCKSCQLHAVYYCCCYCSITISAPLYLPLIICFSIISYPTSIHTLLSFQILVSHPRHSNIGKTFEHSSIWAQISTLIYISVSDMNIRVWVTQLFIMVQG